MGKEQRPASDDGGLAVIDVTLKLSRDGRDVTYLHLGDAVAIDLATLDGDDRRVAARQWADGQFSPPDPSRGDRYNVFVGCVVIVGLLAAIAAMYGWGSPEQRATIALVWALAPPLFFFGEWLWRGADLARKPHEFAIYQQSQALAAQIWTAIAGILGALYLQSIVP